MSLFHFFMGSIKVIFFHYITERGSSSSPYGSISLSLNNKSSSPQGNSNLIIHHPPSYRPQGLGSWVLFLPTQSWHPHPGPGHSSSSSIALAPPSSLVRTPLHPYICTQHYRQDMNHFLQSLPKSLHYSAKARPPLLLQQLLHCSSVGLSVASQ